MGNMRKITDALNQYRVVLLITFAAFYFSFVNNNVPLLGDEAYYWLWSRNLDLSYFDHPPMVAYLIKIFTLFSNKIYMVRMTSVFCMTICSLYTYKLAKEIYNEKVAFLSLITLILSPTTIVGYRVITPDSPLVLFWSMSA
jgi:4-amino-4-deoxy-L-arabinose transferase-like glycosyltransferase